MNQLKIALLTITLFISSFAIAQPTEKPAPNMKADLIELITQLAKMTDMAGACGEHMNYFGKKALEGGVCKDFNDAFIGKWSSREDLKQMVDNYMLEIEQGKVDCENCRMMLQRVEELRITVAYYIDYMEFMSTF